MAACFPMSVIVKTIGDTGNSEIRAEVVTNMPSRVKTCFDTGIRSSCGIRGGFSLLTANNYVAYLMPFHTVPVDVSVQYRLDKLAPKCPLEHICTHTHANGTVLCVCDDSVLAYSAVKTREELELEAEVEASDSRARSATRRRFGRSKRGKYTESEPEEEYKDPMNRVDMEDNDDVGDENGSDEIKLLIEEMLFKLKSLSSRNSVAVIAQEKTVPTNASYTPGLGTTHVDDGTKREELMLSRRVASASTRQRSKSVKSVHFGASQGMTSGPVNIAENIRGSRSGRSVSGTGVSDGVGGKGKMSDQRLIAIIHGDSLQLMTEPPKYNLSEEPTERQQMTVALSRVLPEGTAVLSTILSLRTPYEADSRNLKRRVLVVVQKLEMTTRIVCIDITDPSGGVVVAETAIADYYACGDIANDMIVFCSYNRIYFIRIIIGVTSAPRAPQQSNSLVADVALELCATALVHYKDGEGPTAVRMTRENNLWMSQGISMLGSVGFAHVLVLSNRLSLRFFRLPSLTPVSVVPQYSGIPTYTMSLTMALGLGDVSIKHCSMSASTGNNMFLIHPHRQTPVLVALPLPRSGINPALQSIGTLHLPTRIPWHAPPTLFEAAALATTAHAAGAEHLRDACLSYAVGWDKRFIGSMMPSPSRAGLHEDIQAAYALLLSPAPPQPHEIIAVGKLHAFLQLTGYTKEARRLEKIFGVSGLDNLSEDVSGPKSNIQQGVDGLLDPEEESEGDDMDDGCGPILRWD